MMNTQFGGICILGAENPICGNSTAMVMRIANNQIMQAKRTLLFIRFIHRETNLVFPLYIYAKYRIFDRIADSVTVGLWEDISI